MLVWYALTTRDAASTSCPCREAAAKEQQPADALAEVAAGLKNLARELLRALRDQDVPAPAGRGVPAQP